MDNLNNYYDIKLKEARLEELFFKAKKLEKDFIFIKESLENKKALEKLFKDNNPEIVINLAAQAGVRYSLENPQAYINSNILGFSNLIEESKKNKVKNFIYASSSSVYGGNKNLPFSEKNGVDHPVSLYAATKKSNELIAHTYSHLFNLPCTGLRFFTVYGPWGRPDMALFLFTKAILEDKPIKVFNYGKMIRDFTYIDDIIESMVRLIRRPAEPCKNFDFKNPNPSRSWAPNMIFNIGNSKPVELEKYINALEKSLNKEAYKIYLPIQPGDVSETAADTSALEEWTNFKPNTKIEVGIENFVNWYTDFYGIKISK